MKKVGNILKASIRPLIAIFSSFITLGFVAGRFYERTYMMASEDWVKIKR